MKFSLLCNRRSTTTTFRSSSSLLDPSSPTSLFWLTIHGLCCLTSLLLGYRFSHIVLYFFLFSTSITTPLLLTETNLHIKPTTSKVIVGRHGIRIRPYPHPNPIEVMKAHHLLKRVQTEQKSLYGVRNAKTVIAITPTYVRTFQSLHLTGVMHSLMNVPYDLIWIVVEAGGVTNETAKLIAMSKLKKTVHIGIDSNMPNTWDDRYTLESEMRIRALRVVREEKMDGVVMFVDDSNMHSMELFDEVQSVRWFGALSVGILAHSGNADELLNEEKKEKEKEGKMPVQGPRCDSLEKLVGWRVFDTRPYAKKVAVYVDDKGTVLPRKMEWSGFVLNSRLLWKDDGERPSWVKDRIVLDDDEEIDSPLSFVKDPSMVEPLGSCGRRVLLWWLRVEARADSKFPPGWIINSPLEITVPSKRTPWPDSSSEFPDTIKRRSTKQSGSKSKSSKEKQELKGSGGIKVTTTR